MRRRHCRSATISYPSSARIPISPLSLRPTTSVLPLVTVWALRWGFMGNLLPMWSQATGPKKPTASSSLRMRCHGVYSCPVHGTARTGRPVSAAALIRSLTGSGHWTIMKRRPPLPTNSGRRRSQSSPCSWWAVTPKSPRATDGAWNGDSATSWSTRITSIATRSTTSCATSVGDLMASKPGRRGLPADLDDWSNAVVRVCQLPAVSPASVACSTAMASPYSARLRCSSGV